LPTVVIARGRGYLLVMRSSKRRPDTTDAGCVILRDLPAIQSYRPV